MNFFNQNLSLCISLFLLFQLVSGVRGTENGPGQPETEGSGTIGTEIQTVDDVDTAPDELETIFHKPLQLEQVNTIYLVPRYEWEITIVDDEDSDTSYESADYGLASRTHSFMSATPRLNSLRSTVSGADSFRSTSPEIIEELSPTPTLSRQSTKRLTIPRSETSRLNSLGSTVSGADSFRSTSPEIIEELSPTPTLSRQLTKRLTIPRSELSNSSSFGSNRGDDRRVVQFCPISDIDIPQWRPYVNDKKCVANVNLDRKRCRSEVKPKIVKKFTSCGNGGILYDFEYNLCLPSQKFDAEQPMHVDEPEETPFHIYAICFDEKQRIPLYTEHSITSITELQETPDLQNYQQYLQTDMYGSNDDLDDIAKQYNKFIESSQNSDPEDYLLPQMLIPSTDTKPTFVRDANLHYISVRLQYKRLAEQWDKMNRIVWNKLSELQLLSKTTIYTGATDDPNIVVDEEKGDFFTVPFLWWRLIRTYNKNVDVVIVFYNVPKNYSTEQINFVCPIQDGICDKHFALESTEEIGQPSLSDENIHVQCCPQTNKVLERIGMTKFIEDKTDDELLARLDQPGISFLFRKKSKKNSGD